MTSIGDFIFRETWFSGAFVRITRRIFEKLLSCPRGMTLPCKIGYIGVRVNNSVKLVVTLVLLRKLLHKRIAYRYKTKRCVKLSIITSSVL